MDAHRTRAAGRARLACRALVALLTIGAPMLASAARISADEVAKICASADGVAHCGRLIEAQQLRRLPGLARREGDTLLVNLYPEGVARFTDRDDAPDPRSYSLWDSLDAINAVLIYTTGNDGTSFVLLSRRSNRRFTLPSEPVLSPDRQRLVTADVCPTQCANEVAVWHFVGDTLVKELAWKPPAAWTDATATWRDADTLLLEYSTASQASQKVERALGDPSWTRAATH